MFIELNSGCFNICLKNKFDCYRKKNEQQKLIIID